jgi:uncharacterized membrane protein (DUF2068 family)
VALAIAAYATVELVEGVGLWLQRRWAEYLTVVATAAFLPIEVHDLIRAVTPTRLAAFALNVAAVVYLLVAKRLFGLRGGREAYERERTGRSLLELDREAEEEAETGQPAST